MRKNENRFPQSEQDDNLNSRMQLKNKLNFVSNQFSISRLTDSLTEHHKINTVFPQINEPTLDLKEEQISEPQKNSNYITHHQSNHRDGLTTRNIYQDKSSFQLIALQQKNQELQQALRQQQTEISKLKKKNQKLSQQVDQIKRQSLQYRQTIDRQQKIIDQLNNRESNKIQQSRQSIKSSISYLEESIDSFCPQLLSPQETVQLLQKLLRKVSKSCKMIRRLSNQGTIHQIIQQIQKS